MYYNDILGILKKEKEIWEKRKEKDIDVFLPEDRADSENIIHEQNRNAGRMDAFSADGGGVHFVFCQTGDNVAERRRQEV